MVPWHSPWDRVCPHVHWLRCLVQPSGDVLLCTADGRRGLYTFRHIDTQGKIRKSREFYKTLTFSSCSLFFSFHGKRPGKHHAFCSRGPHLSVSRPAQLSQRVPPMLLGLQLPSSSGLCDGTVNEVGRQTQSFCEAFWKCCNPGCCK